MNSIKRYIIVLGAILCFLCPSNNPYGISSQSTQIAPLPQQQSPPNTYNLTEISHAISSSILISNPEQILVQADCAYVKFNGNQINIINISNPQSIQIIKTLNSPDNIIKMQIQGEILYALRSNALIAFNISNPMTANQIMYHPYSQTFVNFLIDGNSLYLFNTDSEMMIFVDNWGMGQNLSYISLSHNYISDVLKYQDLIFIGTAIGYLNVVNVEDPYGPVMNRTAGYASAIRSFARVDRTLYIGFDASVESRDITTFVSLSSISMGPVKKIVPFGDMALILTDNYIPTLNISNPLQIRHIIQLDMQTQLYGLAIWGIYMLVSTSNRLYLIQFAQYVQPNMLYTSTEFSNTTVISGRYAYFANRLDGVKIIDIFNRQQVGNINTGGIAVDVVVKDNILYILYEDDNIRMYNISNPQAPVYIFDNFFGSQYNSYTLNLYHNYLLVSRKAYGLTILNISDPTKFTILSYIPAQTSTLKSQMQGNKLWVIDEDYIRIFDATDITTPQLIYMHGFPTIKSATIDLPYLYIGTEQTVGIWNVTNDYSWHIISQSLTPNGHFCDIIRHGSMIIGANDQKGNYIINVTIPTSPFHLFQPTGLDKSYDLAIGGGFLATSKGSSGFKIEKIIECGLDDFNNTGIRFIDRFWGKMAVPPTQDPDNGGNDPGNDSTDTLLNDFLMNIASVGAPIGVVAIIVYLVLKSRKNSGIKFKKEGFKSITPKEPKKQSGDDFFDSEF